MPASDPAAVPAWLGMRQARTRPGLRLVLLRGLPSPWSLAARALFDVKRLTYAPVYRAPDDPPDALRAWTGQDSYPVALWNHERPRSQWAEILLLAERLAPIPRLVPPDAAGRARVLGLSHELCGELGLGWCRRPRPYLAGDALSALDVYWASFCNVIAPLPARDLGVSEDIRAAFGSDDPGILAACTPALRAHRDAVYRDYLRLPLDV